LKSRAVTNTTCLIALERIGQLQVLPEVFSGVLAPPLVHEEFGSSPAWLQIRAATDAAVVAALKTQLDEGEAHAIALAVEIGDAVLILDDKKARRVARQMGLKIVGTIGVLLRAKKHGAIPALQPLLAALQQAGFRMTAPLYTEALRLAGETGDHQ
jgi:predicted nucleic acid-binding protein